MSNLKKNHIDLKQIKLNHIFNYFMNGWDRFAGETRGSIIANSWS